MHFNVLPNEACFSLDGTKAQAVVDEIKAAGGDAIAVAGDVGADDFPKKIIDATMR
jgi:3-oxoacyl-[acyl-carrier protein] reductase